MNKEKEVILELASAYVTASKAIVSALDSDAYSDAVMGAIAVVTEMELATWQLLLDKEINDLSNKIKT